MIVNWRKRKRSQPLLFPGWELEQHIRTYKAVSVLTGEIFETLTEAVALGTRRTTNSEADICPDLLHEETGVAIEAKASSARSQHKIDHFQVERYMEMSRNGFTVYYFLWTYEAHHLHRDYGTAGAIIKAVTGSIRSLLVLDISVVHCICESVHQVRGLRYIQSWGPRLEEGYRPYPMTIVSQTFWKALVEDTEQVLRMLDYSSQQDLHSGLVQRTRTSITRDSVRFHTNMFPVYQVTLEPAPF